MEGDLRYIKTDTREQGKRREEPELASWEKKWRLTIRRSSPDSNQPLRGHTLGSLIVLEN